MFLDGARLLEPAPIYHDNGALAYPLRVLVSTSLWHGVLPLWDHWTDGGAPLCSLVVALPLSPIVLVLSAFGIYRPTTFLVELVTLHVLALLGMYRWLCDLADEWAALLGATAYALSAIMLVQAPINLESVASQAMFPWYALGLRQSLRGERRGAAKVAVSLWIMFTTGYLGLNLFALEILTAYVVVDHLVIEHRRLEPGRRRRGLWYAGLGWLLFGGIMNPALLETWRTFGVDLGAIRQVPLDPFVGSAWPESIFTVFWPNQISPFLEDVDGGHVFPLYAGTVVGVLVLAALSSLASTWGTARARRIVVLVAFAVPVFFATLTAAWGGHLFVAVLPLYGKVRFHCWGFTVVVFFATTIAALGMTDLRARGGASGWLLATTGVVVAGCFLLQRGIANVGTLAGYPQVYVLPAVALAASRRLRLAWPRRAAVLVALTIVEIALVARQIPSLREGVPPRLAAVTRRGADELAVNETMKTDGFPAPPNERTPPVPINQQYFTKVPTIVGYSTNIHPTVLRLQFDPRLWDLLGRLFYAADASGMPIVDRDADVTVRELVPDRVVAVVRSAEPSQLTWSSPFSAAWRLSVDDVSQEAVANAFGFTSFALPAGSHVIELRYRPPGLAASAILSACSVLVTLALALGGPRDQIGR